jgi:hypothetical protein
MLLCLSLLLHQKYRLKRGLNSAKIIYWNPQFPAKVLKNTSTLSYPHMGQEHYPIVVPNGERIYIYQRPIAPGNGQNKEIRETPKSTPKCKILMTEAFGSCFKGG